MFGLYVLDYIYSLYSRSLPGREGFLPLFYLQLEYNLKIEIRIALTLEHMAFITAIELYQLYFI
jgi:hypothetical protein